MVFVPPDRTVRRERTSRGLAAVLIIMCALVSLSIVAFDNDSAAQRIAVVHPMPTPSFTPVTSTTAPPPATTAALTSRFPLPDGARRVPHTSATWRAHAPLVDVRKFYVRHLSTMGVPWQPRSVLGHGKVVAFTGPINGVGVDALGRLTVRSGKAGVVTITVQQ